MATKKVNPTLKVLKEIRDAIHATNERLDAQVERLDGRIDALTEVVRDGQVRTTTELVAVSSAVHDVRDLLIARLDDRDRLEDHERRLQSLEKKVG